MDRCNKKFINWNGKLVEICEKRDKIADFNYKLYDVTFSPCGEYIAFRANDYIELDDSVNFNIYKRWAACTNTPLTFTKCGKFIIFWCQNWIKQISVENGKTIGILKIYGVGQILAFSPSYKYLSCNGDFLYIISFETKELIFKEDWNRSNFHNLICWSPCEDKIAFCDFSGLSLFDIEKQTIIAQIRVNFKIFISICYYNQRSVLVNYKGLSKLWDLESQKAQKQIETIEHYVIAVSFSQCEQYLYRVSKESTIEKYNITEKSFETIIKGNKKKKVVCTAFSHCKTYCALGINGNSIELWNLDTKQLFTTFKEDFKNISSLIFSSSGILLFSGHCFSIIIWNLEKKKSIAKLESDTTILALSPDEKYIASSHNQIVLIWRNDHKYNMIRHLPPQTWCSVTAITFSDCSQFLFTGNSKGYIIMWDFLNRKKLRQISDCETSIWCLITTRKGLVSGISSQIVLRDDKTLEKINEIKIKLNSVESFATTKSGEWVAFGGLHNTVKICRLAGIN